MHSLIHIEHARVDATERRRRATSRLPRPPKPQPPPIRWRAAHAVARVATRLDAESARRATA
ncbi:MAG TPA: hypothetical protein VF533_22380 [Solirubrobacteraceae bacterium]|jgi:hypothetical protein